MTDVQISARDQEHVHTEQDIFALSELLAAVMEAAEEAVLPVEKQAWEALQDQILEVDTLAQLRKRMQNQLALVTGSCTYNNVCRFALWHISTPFAPRAV